MLSSITIKGNLQKMATNLAIPVQYWLLLNQDKIPLNEYLGKDISLVYTGKINCIACNRVIKKSYQQGYCFLCTKALAQCDLCIVKPELCHHHKGTCREPEWGKGHCFAPHIVYLANSSGIKVGITREAQIPTRWLDQGAVQALPIVRTQSRYQAGLIEVCFAEFVADNTNWRKMLQGNIKSESLALIRDELFFKIAAKMQTIAAKFNFGDIELLTSEPSIDITYPVLEYPKKIVALNFTKEPKVEGTLLGIKGQYLIFNHGVINIRSFAGYEVSFAVLK